MSIALVEADGRVVECEHLETGTRGQILEILELADRIAVQEYDAQVGHLRPVGCVGQFL